MPPSANNAPKPPLQRFPMPPKPGQESEDKVDSYKYQYQYYRAPPAATMHDGRPPSIEEPPELGMSMHDGLQPPSIDMSEPAGLGMSMPMPMQSRVPKVILVTGANRGLGLATIKWAALRDPTCIFILGSRVVENGERAVEQLKEAGVFNRIEVLKLDVNNDDDIYRVFWFVRDTFGRLDVLINNAGVHYQLPTPDIEAPVPARIREAYTAVYRTNTISPGVMIHMFLPLLWKSSSPKVINISAGVGSCQKVMASVVNSSTHAPHYGSSKVALNGLTAHGQAEENARKKFENESHQTSGRSFVKNYSVSTRALRTHFTNYSSEGKEPEVGAEVVLRLIFDDTDKYSPGFWECEEGEMRRLRTSHVLISVSYTIMNWESSLGSD